MLPKYLVGGTESGGQDLGLLVTEGCRGNLSLHIGGPANLETYLDLINIPSSKRGLLNPGVTIIRDNGSIYRRGNFDVFWPSQDQSGGKKSKSDSGFLHLGH